MKLWKPSVRYAALMLGFGGLVGCGAANEQASDLKITNGRVIGENVYPAVFQLEVKDALGQSGTCTGTFISDSIAITAAHCVNTGDKTTDGRVKGEVRYVVEHQGVRTDKPEVVATSLTLFQHPEWDESAGVAANDIGIIVFPKGTARGVARLRNQPPHTGEALTIVGYGINTYSGFSGGDTAGVKRMGRNTIKDVKDGFIEFTGAPDTTDASGENSASGSGDSGGPLFINGELAGTTSGGGVKDGVKHSFYVDLTTETSQKFLKRFLH